MKPKNTLIHSAALRSPRTGCQTEHESERFVRNSKTTFLLFHTDKMQDVFYQILLN